MKYKLFTAALALGVLSLQPGHAQTTVIPGKDNSTVIIEQDGRPPAVIDVNKDINGKTKAAATAKSSSETTGNVSRDNDGNRVEKPKKDCIRESWTGGRPTENCG